MDRIFDIIVIGGGHAGCEAALSCSRMGLKTLLLSMNLDSIAQMSCNPAIGGLAKGHIVREIDALGGDMAKVADRTAIQYRLLNTKKGPAVWAPRAQCDRKLYQHTMKNVLEKQENLEIIQQEAVRLLVDGRYVTGVLTNTKAIFKATAVIVTPGTFMNGVIHIGQAVFPAGRAGEFASIGLSESLKEIGFEVKRLKTGTPPRINKSSADLSKFKTQSGDERPSFFSYSTKNVYLKQVPCYAGYTNKSCHDVISKNLHRAPLYTGQITATGPRYCPSIEVKVVKYSDKERHQIFLEPEGLNTEELYINGLATSLPQDVQIEMMHAIDGLQNAQITRFGYAIEYDFAPPTQLKPTLETKLVENLYFAGQINGTSGYEEAAAQGMIAGINAAMKIKNKPPFILNRSEAYIGVLIDDLVTKGTQEPYRMFTSRAEYRLSLRQDNADLRLTEHGYNLGLITSERYQEIEEKKKKIRELLEYLNKKRHGNSTLAEVLKRPDVDFEKLTGLDKDLCNYEKEVTEQAQIETKYGGYIDRERARVEKFKKLEKRPIPYNLDYENIKGLKSETKEKLKQIKPISVGQAARISGVSQADLSLLLVYMRKNIDPRC